MRIALNPLPLSLPRSDGRYERLGKIGSPPQPEVRVIFERGGVALDHCHWDEAVCNEAEITLQDGTIVDAEGLYTLALQSWNVHSMYGLLPTAFAG